LKGLLKGFWWPFRLLKSVKYSQSYGLNEVYDKYNFWKAVSDVSALDLVVGFYCKHPVAPRHIQQADFDTIFLSGTIALRCSNLEREVSVREPY